MSPKDDETVRIHVFSEVTCDEHGLTKCACCGFPLKVREWEETHQLVDQLGKELEEEIAATNAKPIQIAVAFVSGAAVMFAAFIGLRLMGVL